jgi:large subunit ribosomal protein L29
MKPGELKGLSEDELRTKSEELSRELFNLKFRHASSQLEQTSRLGQVRRDLARVKTAIRERQLGIERGGA